MAKTSQQKTNPNASGTSANLNSTNLNSTNLTNANLPSRSLTFVDISPEQLEKIRPFVRTLEAREIGSEELLELLRQPEDVKAAAVDLYLTRLAFGLNSTTTREKQPSPQRLTEEQKEAVTKKLMKLRSEGKLNKTERIEKVFREHRGQLPGLTIHQVRAFEAHVTMALESRLGS